MFVAGIAEIGLFWICFGNFSNAWRFHNCLGISGNT